MKISTDKK